MGQERVSILVENPNNAFALSASETKELIEGLTKKQLDEIFKKADQAAANNYELKNMEKSISPEERKNIVFRPIK